MRTPQSLDLWIVCSKPGLPDFIQENAPACWQPNCRVVFPSEVTSRVESAPPACLVIDDVCGDESAIQLVEEIHAKSWPAPALLTAKKMTSSRVIQALKRGCFGILEQPVDPAVLHEELQLAHEFVVRRLPIFQEISRAKELVDALGRTERDLLHLLATGRPLQEIATEQRISLRTLQNRKTRLFQGLGARTLAELVRTRQLAERTLAPDFVSVRWPA